MDDEKKSTPDHRDQDKNIEKGERDHANFNKIPDFEYTPDPPEPPQPPPPPPSDSEGEKK